MNDQSLPQLIDAALDERPPVTPGKRACYHRKLSRLVWLELAEYRSVKEEAAEWAARKEQEAKDDGPDILDCDECGKTIPGEKAVDQGYRKAGAEVERWVCPECDKAIHDEAMGML